MLSQLISELGTAKVARQLGVSKAAVSTWKRNNSLPTTRQGALLIRTEKYEAELAKMAGISIDELRQRIAK
ncbi:hypothetical protein [Zymobacter sp. IVIA_5232.4 C2]|uniref:hypothetical protein n=1 Tax=Zymobacter sp. IVIA_5232.4 C2 TaxID=3394855 RepID=UPI0039C44353